MNNGTNLHAITQNYGYSSEQHPFSPPPTHGDAQLELFPVKDNEMLDKIEEVVGDKDNQIALLRKTLKYMLVVMEPYRKNSTPADIAVAEEFLMDMAKKNDEIENIIDKYK